MLSVSVLIFVLAVALEIRLLRRESEGCFRQALSAAVRGFGPVIAFFLVVGMATHQGAEFYYYSFLVLFTPFYAFERRTWIRAVQAEKGLFREVLTRSLKLTLGAFGVLFHWVLGMAWLSFAYRVVTAFLDVELSAISEVMIATGVSSGLIMALIYQATKDFSPRGFRFNIGWRQGGLSVFQRYVWPAMLGLAFAGVSTALILGREIQPYTPFSELMDSASSSEVILIMLGLALLMAPLVEELTFRGYFFYVLKRVKGKVFAVVTISALFTLLHVNQYWGDWPAIAMVGCLGFVLTGLRSATGSVIPSTVMHYVYNFSVTLIPVVILMAQNPAFMEYHARHDQLSVEEKEKLLLSNIENNPRFVMAARDLAELYLQEGRNLEKALELVEQALSREPENSEYLDTKAGVLTALGQYEKALRIRTGLLGKMLSRDRLGKQQREIEALKGVMGRKAFSTRETKD